MHHQSGGVRRGSVSTSQPPGEMVGATRLNSVAARILGSAYQPLKSMI